MKEIRVSVVEDDEPTRHALALLLTGTPGFACHGAHATAEAGWRAIGADPGDVVLLDLELPRMSGTDLIRRLRSSCPRIEILVLTIHDTADRLFEALRAGASGYLIKPCPPARLLEAIAEVHAGGSPMSSQVARKVLLSLRDDPSSAPPLSELTLREREILRWLARGLRYKEIAVRLSISPFTVRTHLHHIYEKLQVRSATQAAARFLTQGTAEDPSPGEAPPGQ